MGQIIMSIKEIRRVEVIQQAERREIKQNRAGEILGISSRQVKRLVSRIRKEGIAGLCHRNRGKKSNKRIPTELEKKIIKRYREKYHDFGPTLAQEKLLEDGIEISRESLRKILIKHDMWIVRKNRARPLHVWRERRSSEGELIQIDGSHHSWLEDRLDQEFCLMAYIDDATSIVYARFYEYEGLYPILDSMQLYTALNGRPRAVYLDRHSTYKARRKTTIEEDLNGSESQTQFEAVMKEIDVEVIHAMTPQAKGRVERLFKTLQDRLVKEMRLANICSIDEANNFLKIYLPKYNEKFSVAAKDPAKVWRPLPSHLDVKRVFSKRYKRTILKDYTIRWQKKIFLIQNPTHTLRRQAVEIREGLDGHLTFSTKNKDLCVKQVAEMPSRSKKITMTEAKKRLQKSLGTQEKSKKSWMDDFYFGKQYQTILKGESVVA